MFHVEFEEWKKEFKRESCSYFVKSSGKKISGSSKISYFYCNRSGPFQTRGKGVRMIKSQGSSKLDAYCTASMQLSYQPDGSIKAINKTHYGHTCSLGHKPLPQHICSELATQIAMGINFDVMLDKVRNNVNGDHLERVHLLTKKDLNNIIMERAFHLKGHQRHKDDATSIDLWIEELTQQGDIPILFFKKQGHKEATLGSS